MSEYRNLNLDEIDLMTPYAREFAKTGLVPRKMPVTREQVLENAREDNAERYTSLAALMPLTLLKDEQGNVSLCHPPGPGVSIDAQACHIWSKADLESDE